MRSDFVSRRLMTPLAIGVLSVAAMSLGGCATEDFVRKQLAPVDAKAQANADELAAQKAALNGHDARLAGLDKNTREALERANAAGKLAEGKFLYTMVLSDDSVKFPVDGAELSEEAKTRLLDFVQKLKSDNKNVYLEIQGHTDNKGSHVVNRRLGEERAEAVRIFLNQNGVALNRMSTISYGDSSPVAPNKTRAGRAQNRRVVVIVLN